MSDEQSQSPSNPPRKKWLDRLSHLFQGEPKDRHELVGVIQDAEERDDDAVEDAAMYIADFVRCVAARFTTPPNWWMEL